MGKALYRQYRPISLDEVVGQDHITTTLRNSLKNNTISHAYLFTGPRGVGKTSIARIFAYAINNLPYQNDQPHIDIIEIDAASNRRIDEIRDLRDKVHIMPTLAKYKVYIIDEVHMLTKEAFNALLKTLEEPPAHVIFILATTELHKVPDTIISRTQRFGFKPIDPKTASKHLRNIATKEKINISDDALDLIAQHGDGSFRDSISLLDQISTNDNISVETIYELLGIVPKKEAGELLDLVNNADVSGIIDTLTKLSEQGIHAPQISKQLSSLIRQQIIDEKSLKQINFLKTLVGVSAHSNPDRWLEIVLLEEALSDNNQPTETVIPDSPVNTHEQEKQSLSSKASAQDSSKTTTTTPSNIKYSVDANINNVQQSEPIQKNHKTPKSSNSTQPVNNDSKEISSNKSIPENINTLTTEKDNLNASSSIDSARILDASSLTQEDWNTVLKTIKQKYNTLYGILRVADFNYEAPVLTLTHQFAFHQRRVAESKNRDIIVKTIQQLFNITIELNCKLDKQPKKPVDNPTDHKDDISANIETTVSSISNIFGGAELLES